MITLDLIISYTYNGKKVKSIEDGVAQAVLDHYKEVVKEKVAPFTRKINDTNGSITIDYTENGSMEGGYEADVHFHNMPDELAIRLKKVIEN